MPNPTRPTDRASNRDLHRYFVRMARVQERRVNSVRDLEAARQSRQSGPGGDARSWRDAAIKNPIVQGEIADQQFYNREGILHGIAAIVDGLDRIEAILTQLLLSKTS